MLESLDKARRLPEDERKAVAFVAALVITGIITLVWFVSLVSSDSSNEEVVVEERVSPFAEVGEHFSDIVRGIGTQFEAVKGQFEAVQSDENAL